MKDLYAKLTSRQVNIQPFTKQDVNQDVIFQGRGEVVSINDQGEKEIMVISPNELYITKQEGAIIKQETTSGGQTQKKSHSKKVRDILFIVWSTQGYDKKYPEFILFYNAFMERLEHLLSLSIDGDLSIKKVLHYE